MNSISVFRSVCLNNFRSLQISGSDIALAETKPSSGDYKGQWNTKGFGINKSNTREDLLINIQVYFICSKNLP